jgi:Holliday junction resolvasome RuvABC endonuclease subunit
MTYTVLSLDLGTNTGWALVQDGVITESGILSLPKPDKHHPGHRFITFSNWLRKYKTVNEIFHENVPRFESAKAAMVYCGLLAILQMFCLTQGIRMTSIMSKSVKKEFSGNGNSDKKMMCDVAHRIGWQGGHPSTDIGHDECDAIATAWVIMKRREVVIKFKHEVVPA